MYVSYAGLPLEQIEKTSKTGRTFIVNFRKVLHLGKTELPPPYSVYQAQATQIIMNAIAKSNGTRASVTQQMFKQRVNNGIMGTFHFDKNGDIVPTKAISFDKLSVAKKTGTFVYVSIRKVGT
jgi:ABC-type branched-subunit amino acid transport system substrate-binding protein